MSNKSKAVVVEKKVINEDYYNAVSELIEVCNRMFNSTSNQISEIYRIASIVSFFARQKAYLDKLREQFSVCKKNKDVQGIRNVLFKIENGFESKTYDDLWSDMSQMYDNMIASIQQESTNDDINLVFRTSEEILEGCRQYYINQEQSKFDEQVKSIEFMLNL